jgi:hypothetical protein
MPADYRAEVAQGHATAKDPNLILLDPDVIGGYEFSLPTDAHYKVLHGHNFTALLALFKRARMMQDMSLNGMEHMPREAVLFDCWPMLSREENGGDEVDFPMPPAFKIDPVERSYTFQTNYVRHLLDSDAARVNALFARLRQATLEGPTRLLHNAAVTFESRALQFEIHANGRSSGFPDADADATGNDGAKFSSSFPPAFPLFHLPSLLPTFPSLLHSFPPTSLPPEIYSFLFCLPSPPVHPSFLIVFLVSLLMSVPSFLPSCLPASCLLPAYLSTCLSHFSFFISHFLPSFRRSILQRWTMRSCGFRPCLFSPHGR